MGTLTLADRMDETMRFERCGLAQDDDGLWKTDSDRDQESPPSPPSNQRESPIDEPPTSLLVGVKHVH
jgi:hypothetical protein